MDSGIDECFSLNVVGGRGRYIDHKEMECLSETISQLKLWCALLLMSIFINVELILMIQLE
jgi:hypothetical protein